LQLGLAVEALDDSRKNERLRQCQKSLRCSHVGT
jgi:hypothetical protein